jgi:hypothetical protein
MQPELTPTEARCGVISGCVITVLVVSSIGAHSLNSRPWPRSSECG